MNIAIIIMWIIWGIPAVMYIFWKRGDWYLILIPPIALTIIALVISIFSEILGIATLAAIHIYIIVSDLIGTKKG